jgi:putative FmdB family regulatory protein
MPTYEYRCPEGHEFEHFYRTISAAVGELPCPVCGKTGLRKVSGGSALLFKGSGFYITDYGKDGKKDLRSRSGKSEGGESGSTKEASEKPSSESAPSAPAEKKEKKESKGPPKGE